MNLNDSYSLLIVDLCHTLIAENTTKAFLDDWLIRDGWRQRLRKSILGRKRPTFLLALRGLSKQFLYEQADDYVRDRLSRIANPEPLDAVSHAQKRGLPVYLASASLDPIAAAVARQLSLNGVVSSRLKYDTRDLCAGFMALNVTGKKLAHLRLILTDSQLRDSAVYTDNIEDTDILRAAKYPHFLGDRNSLSKLSEAELGKITFLPNPLTRDLYATR